MNHYKLIGVPSEFYDQQSLNRCYTSIKEVLSSLLIESLEMITTKNYFSISFTDSFLTKNPLEPVKKFTLLLRPYLSSQKIDFIIFHDPIPSYSLAIFDMDSTLITQEVIDEMAKIYGVGNQVQEITKMAMNNEINFDQSLRKRISLLKGFKKKDLNDVLKSLTLNKGVQRTIECLRRHKIKTAVVSGGFDFFAENIKQILNLDFSFSNRLEFVADELSGVITGPILDGEEKKKILLRLAKSEGIDPRQTLAIGDGANDIPMLETAGLGISFHAKENVKNKITHHIDFGDMTTLAFFLNLSL